MSDFCQQPIPCDLVQAQCLRSLTVSSPNIVENVNQCQNCEALLAAGLKEPVTQPQPVSGQTSALAPLLGCRTEFGAKSSHNISTVSTPPIVSPESGSAAAPQRSVWSRDWSLHAAGRTPQYLVLRSDATPQLQQSQLEIFYFKDSVNFMHAMRID